MVPGTERGVEIAVLNNVDRFSSIRLNSETTIECCQSKGIGGVQSVKEHTG